MFGMKRREFISLLGGAAVTWPRAARAQQTTKSRKVGLLHSGESTVVNMRVAAIREGLNGPDNQRDLSFEIIIRLADGDVSRLPTLATDLVNNRVVPERAGCSAMGRTSRTFFVRSEGWRARSC
jgi:putative tryptophan/tyrosine transport system substrate-binding protein